MYAMQGHFSRNFGIYGGKRLYRLCGFTKIRGDVFYLMVLRGKYLQSYVKSGILYPNGVSWIQVRLPAPLQGQGPRRPVLVPSFSSFTFLSFTLPARKGNGGGSTCTGRCFVLSGSCHFARKHVFRLGKDVRSTACAASRIRV